MRWQKFIIIIIFLVGINILAWLVVFDLAEYKYLEVTFFDVGQGDAIFIETPQRHQILIDGGPDTKILEKLGKKMPFWDRTIDLIVLTHPEYDHMVGLLEVLKRYKVENVLWTGVVRETSEYEEWMKLLEKEKARIIFAQAGQKVTCTLCYHGKWEFLVLFPQESIVGKIQKRSSNNTSVVSKLVMAKTRVLFNGDIEKEVESKLITNQIDLKAEVLKIAHHGSKTSTSEDFINAVSPQIAVISVGRNNPYGHPDSEILKTLQNKKIKVLRTDKHGDVSLISNGIFWKLK